MDASKFQALEQIRIQNLQSSQEIGRIEVRKTTFLPTKFKIRYILTHNSKFRDHNILNLDTRNIEFSKHIHQCISLYKTCTLRACGKIPKDKTSSKIHSKSLSLDMSGKRKGRYTFHKKDDN